MFTEPFYDPAKSYQENFDQGPFGLFANTLPSSALHTAPKHSFLGYAIAEPFGIPAGPLLNGRFVKAALDRGFDLPVYKTVRTRRHAAHAWPNVLAVELTGDLHPGRTLLATGHYAEPLSITNSFGVPSFGPEFWQPDLADAVQHAGPGQVVVASYQGTTPDGGGVAEYIADFRLGARLLRETGVKIVEVNLSCPNEGTANLLCFDTQRARLVVEAIKEELGEVPLIIKIAYFVNDARLEQLLHEVGGTVDGIAAINTISADVVDVHGQQALPGEGRLSSGVCGAAIQWAGVEMVQRLKRWRERLGQHFAIVGVGGVADVAGYRRYRAAGADAVMSATGAMWDPTLAEEIKAAEAQTSAALRMEAGVAA